MITNIRVIRRVSRNGELFHLENTMTGERMSLTLEEASYLATHLDILLQDEANIIEEEPDYPRPHL